MSQHYSDPRREADEHALPDVEVWQEDAVRCEDCDSVFPRPNLDDYSCPSCDDDQEHNTITEARNQWWWWFCFPGCVPDSEPNGPFETEAEALKDAQEGADEDGGFCADCEQPTPNGTQHECQPQEGGE